MVVTDNSRLDVRIRPELELLFCCARTRPDAVTTERAKTLLRQAVDWDYLLRTALRQKVMPCLYRQLSTTFRGSAPEEFMGRMHDLFYLNAARNHLLTEELCEVLRSFEERGIQAIPFKGPALALRIYQDVAQRQFSDLDILIRREDMIKASDLLRREGYRSDHRLTPAQETVFLKIECEHLFSHEQKRGFVDLHWEFVPRYFSLNLDSESFWERLETISFESLQVPSFSPEDLLLILCIHAAKEFWSCLVWLCDIAELTRISPNLDWDTVIRRATSAGARRMLYLSLLLVQELLGATIPEQVVQSIEADSALRKLALDVKQILFRDEVEEKGVSQFLRPARALERLTDRARFRVLLATTPTPEDWTFVKLPNQLSFLYYLTRPVRLAKKYLSRR